MVCIVFVKKLHIQPRCQKLTVSKLDKLTLSGQIEHLENGLFKLIFGKIWTELTQDFCFI